MSILIANPTFQKISNVSRKKNIMNNNNVITNFPIRYKATLAWPCKILDNLTKSTS